MRRCRGLLVSMAGGLMLLLDSIGFAQYAAQAAAITVDAKGIREASGMARSSHADDLFWVLNDSGSAAEIYLLGRDGIGRGKVAIRGIKNIDWEAMAQFQIGSQSFLLIADTGDNGARRKTVQLHVIKEPQLNREGQLPEQTSAVDVAWTIDFTYPNGPRDCESVAVDAKHGKILLLSKRTEPAEFYQLPIKPKPGHAALLAQPMGSLKLLEKAKPSQLFGNQPVDMDLSADGKQLAILTYHGVYLLQKLPTQSWQEVFQHPAKILGVHRLPKAEAIAFSPDAEMIAVLSEGRSPPMRFFQRAKAASDAVKYAEKP